MKAVHGCRLLSSDGGIEFQPSPFFSQQLTAFELWLQHGSRDQKPPEQLPIVLQVLAVSVSDALPGISHCCAAAQQQHSLWRASQ